MNDLYDQIRDTSVSILKYFKILIEKTSFRNQFYINYFSGTKFQDLYTVCKFSKQGFTSDIYIDIDCICDDKSLANLARKYIQVG